MSLPSLFSRRMDSLFQDMFRLDDRKSLLSSYSFGAVNVKSKPECYEMRMALPGLDDEDINVEIKGNILYIHSEAKKENKKDSDEYLVQEYEHFHIDRSFSLPRDVEVDKIEAKMERGVLLINLPRMAEAENSRKIAIKKAKK